MLPASVTRLLSRFSRSCGLMTAREWLLSHFSQWVQRHTVLLVIILILSLSAVFFWQLSALSTQLVRSMALQNTFVYSRSLAEFRSLYTSEVVDRVLPHGVEVTHDYASRDGAIPLPATLSLLLGKRIGEDLAGNVAVRLYSNYPFPWRKDGGIKDDFERQALEAFRLQPDQPFYRFEKHQGQLTLRYATADRMRPTCVNCHNTHPDSPKRDWKVGDVRGVLEITRSLGWATAEVASGLKRTALVLGLCSAIMVALVATALGGIRRTHATLLSGERRFQAVMESANDAIVTADKTSTIRYLNKAAGQMFGYRTEELLGQSLARLMPEQFRALHKAGMDRYLRTGEAHVIGKPVTLVGQKKDGSEFPIELTLAAWQVDADTFFSGIIRDISDRKNAELALQQRTVELERSNAELERFAYIASHDLQEPLRTVTSFTQLLAQRYGKTDDPEAAEFIGFITESVQRMHELIEGLLAYSRVSRDPEPPRDTDLNQIMRQIIANLDAAIQPNGATVTYDSLPELQANPRQILQLLQNLVGNALKFRGPEPPHVHVSAARIGAEWQVSVRDNGIGIEPQYVERIFVLYQRLHTRDQIPGNGLGLAICKKIVEQHGGRIWVEPGNPGCVFHFTLPG